MIKKYFFQSSLRSLPLLQKEKALNKNFYKKLVINSIIMILLY